MRSLAVRRLLLVVTNALGVAAFAWPFLFPAAVGGEIAHDADAPVILLLVLACVGALLFVELGRGGLGPKNIALIGVLGAAMVVLRLPGGVGGFSAMFIVVLLAGNALGPGFGFVLGAAGTFASGMFVGGFGPWLPFQMVAVGWVGLGAGLLPRGGRWGPRLAALAIYGVISGYLFGAVMNLWFWPFVAGGSGIGWEPRLGAFENASRYLHFYAVTSFVWDSFRAVGNAAMVLLLGRPLLGALDRAARRMNLRTRRNSAVEPLPAGAPDAFETS